MKKEQDYTRDLAEIRSMMERSSKFMSLSGWAGIMAGLYALAGAYVAYAFYDFRPQDTIVERQMPAEGAMKVYLLALAVLVTAMITAVYFSIKKAKARGEKAWNVPSKRLLSNMAAPLVTGGILILLLISKGRTELIAPLTLLFYGLALYNAGNFTYKEVRILGVIQIFLGLISSWFTELGLLFWAAGFGIAHIIYGIYMYFRYDR